MTFAAPPSSLNAPMESKPEILSRTEEIKQYMNLMAPSADDALDMELEQAPSAGKQRRQSGLEERPTKHQRPGGKGQGQGRQRPSQGRPQRGIQKENGSANSSDEVAQMKSRQLASGNWETLPAERGCNLISQDTRLVMFCVELETRDCQQACTRWRRLGRTARRLARHAVASSAADDVGVLGNPAEVSSHPQLP